MDYVNYMHLLPFYCPEIQLISKSHMLKLQHHFHVSLPYAVGSKGDSSGSITILTWYLVFIGS